jgi:hypothetical protein
MNGSAATADTAARSWVPSGRPAVVLATIVATLLLAACAFVLVPVAPSGAAAAQPIDSAAAAQASVRKAHAAVCPGATPTVACTAAGQDWSCSWGSMEDVLVRRSPSSSFAVAC